MKQSLASQFVNGRDELAIGQVSTGAEDNDAAWDGLRHGEPSCCTKRVRQSWNRDRRQRAEMQSAGRFSQHVRAARVLLWHEMGLVRFTPYSAVGDEGCGRCDGARRLAAVARTQPRWRLGLVGTAAALV